MAKAAKLQFLCNSCGSVHPKWMGKCPDCGTWDSLQEYKEPAPDVRRESIAGSGASSSSLSRNATADVARDADPLTLEQIDEADAPRTPTGIGEFDRIL